jgi:hypothetical protein
MSKKLDRQDRQDRHDRHDHHHHDRSDKHHYEEEEDSEEPSNLDSLEGYIEASEMYLEALKLSEKTSEFYSHGCYVAGMTAVYFGKAFLAFTDTDNTEAIKGSLKEAINAYSTAISFFESNEILKVIGTKQFIYTSHLIIEGLKSESHNF